MAGLCFVLLSAVVTPEAQAGDKNKLKARDTIKYEIEISNTGNTCLWEIFVERSAFTCDISTTGEVAFFFRVLEPYIYHDQTLLGLLGPQSLSGGNPLRFWVICPQNGTAVLNRVKPPSITTKKTAFICSIGPHKGTRALLG